MNEIEAAEAALARMQRADTEGLIHYTFKEMIAQLFGRLDKIDDKLNDFAARKADVVVVENLTVRLNHVEDWATGLKAQEEYQRQLIAEHRQNRKDIDRLATESVSRAFVWKVGGGILGVAASVTTVTVALARLLPHH